MGFFYLKKYLAMQYFVHSNKSVRDSLLFKKKNNLLNRFDKREVCKHVNVNFYIYNLILGYLITYWYNLFVIYLCMYRSAL